MKKTYRIDPKTGQLVEVDTEAERRKKKPPLKYIGDSHYDGLRATDGCDISTRAKHREYMRRHGLTTADDFRETWAKKTAHREQYLRHGGSIRRSDIIRAIDDLKEARR